jgi:alkylation response protein AidB-like acyl-CoA dehydrogenase
MSTYLDLNKELTEAEVAIKEQTHRFAEEVLRPASVELDRIADPQDVIKEGSILWDVFKTAYQAGHHIRGLPEDLGGATLSPLAGHIMSEEMGWGSGGLSIGLGVTAFPFTFAHMVAAATGNQELMQEFVLPFAQDKEAKYVGCWAITEPQRGSDAVFIGTEQGNQMGLSYDLSAKLDGDELVINGQKSAWVSNGTIATHAITWLNVTSPGGASGTGVAIVPLNLSGVSKGPPLNKIGQRDLNQGEIFFDDVRVPRQYMLVPPEMYVVVGETVIAAANSGMGATFTGVARAAFEEALAYCKERVQGGRPICEHQAVQLKLFDMFIKVETARAISRAAIIYNAQSQAQMQPPAAQYSIASKVYCTNVAFEVASDAVQLHGGYGLSKEFLIEKIFRDARASMIEDGCNNALSLAGASRLIAG